MVELSSPGLRVRSIPYNSVARVPLSIVWVDFDHSENFAIVQGQLVLQSVHS